MPDGITPHPVYWSIWAPSPWPEDEGEPYRIGACYSTRQQAERAAEQWPHKECWIVEPGGTE